jgi:hypothetical protein
MATQAEALGNISRTLTYSCVANIRLWLPIDKFFFGRIFLNIQGPSAAAKMSGAIFGNDARI